MRSIPVYENYRDYQPPRYVYPTIVRLLDGLAARHTSGLRSIVLTNGAAVGKGKTQRVGGRKHARRDCLGFYHPAWKGEQPFIEIAVDNILAHWGGQGGHRFLAALPLLQDMAFAEVLFHEIGHHLERTIGASAPGGEAAAEAWNKALCRSYFGKRYGYLRPIARLASFFRAVTGRSREPKA